MRSEEWLVFCLWSDNRGEDISEVIEQIKKNQNIKNVLYYCPMEFFYLRNGCSLERDAHALVSLKKILDEKNIKLSVIVGVDGQSDYHQDHHSFNLKNTEYIWWPTYWIYQTYKELITVNPNKKITISNSEYIFNIEKLFICMNNKPHIHRRMLIEELCKNNLFEYGNISWHVDDLNKIPNVLAPYNNLKIDEEKSCWKPKLLSFDDGFDKFKRESYADIPTQYKTSFVNIITESNADVNIISEKTFTAIFLNQPFLICGGRGVHRTLESLGFKMYDEIFDYSFDLETSIEIRISKIVKNLEKIKNQNYNELRKIIEHKIQYNKTLALSIVQNKKYIPDMVKSIYFEKINDTLQKYVNNWLGNLLD